MQNYPELKHTAMAGEDVLSLALRRWFGIGLCVLSMAVGALTFSLGYPQSSPSQSAYAVSHIFMGPFSHASYFPWFAATPLVVIPWASVLLLLTHPLYPRLFTVGTTLIGGGLWWIMGWYCIAAVR